MQRTTHIPAPPAVTDKQHRNDDPQLKFSDEPDCISGHSSHQLHVKMSCGHAVDPNSLTEWCRDLLARKDFRFFCPAPVLVENDKPGRCNQEWEYAEIRRLALLTDEECRYFEATLSENASAALYDMKECPGCLSFVERAEKGNLRVVCPICSKAKGKRFEFCWQCLKKWSESRKTHDYCVCE